MAENPSKIHKDDAEQSKRFVETAKNLDTNEGGKAFDRALKKVTSLDKKPSKAKQGT